MQVVVIGASAGGIEAFRQFFENMPGDSGLAFVVVLHLSADRKSLLTEIIARWTPMSVAEAADGEALAPNHVHVIPPGVVATLKAGKLRLRRLPPDVPREATPIDTLFDSVAADMGDQAIGIVLSGTGHDGSLGLKAIKAKGGLTLAQGSDGSAPQHHGMPDSAIATGAVDLVVPVRDMPRHVMAARSAPQQSFVVRSAVAEVQAARLRICDTLRTQVGHDFSQYKDKTFLRRVGRRMQVLGVERLDDYAERVGQDHGEARLLFRDLLIGVTEFFRDGAAFERVERLVIPRLFEGKGAADAVRLWIPGCATGEEAYSLAMLLREHMDQLDAPPKVQIFATDIDEPAIGTARAGRYPATLLEGLSQERRERFFTRTDASYVVTKEIRDLCTFSAHSLVRDPPFSRMDLVSCRNLLIYLDADLQARVVPSFHYSLVPGGVLLLGSSETVVRHEGLFATLDKEHRIFQRREGPSPPLRVRVGPVKEAPSEVAARPEADETEPARTDWPKALTRASTRVLERFAAPYAVVTAEGDVMHYSSRMGNYLQPALGPPSRSVFEMARRGLHLGLRAALRAAVASGQGVEQVVDFLGDDGAAENVTLVVEPLPGDQDDRPYLIVFKDRVALAAAAEPRAQHSGSDEEALGLVVQIEREMRDTKERLQALTEEHETALEELRSSNEELHSVNEELQSSNEELETSKEEIQSVNEELHTVNVQLQGNVDELDRVNSDLRNLFESTRVATVFLDPNLVIRSFTPETASIYNLIPSDRGRPLTDIVSRLDYEELRDDVREVLATLSPLERRVARRDGSAHYLVRILAYRAPDSSVQGTLITFVDVTTIVEAEAHQRQLVDELNHRVKNMLAVVISLAAQTKRGAATLEEFSDTFLGRVNALSAAYALLSREKWTTVSLEVVLAEVLAPFRSETRPNVRLSGPPLPLEPRSALALGMAIHELGTNASKYGALTAPDGDVRVTWRITDRDDGHWLSLEWQELNGPEVIPPERRGFGTTLIERGLAHDLQGEVKIEFRPSGVVVRVEAPLTAMNSKPITRA